MGADEDPDPAGPVGEGTDAELATAGRYLDKHSDGRVVPMVSPS